MSKQQDKSSQIRTLNKNFLVGFKRKVDGREVLLITYNGQEDYILAEELIKILYSPI